MKKKILSVLLSATLIAAMLAGCGGSEAPAAETAAPAEEAAATTETPAADAGEAVAEGTLVYWSMWEATEPQGKVIKEAADAYSAETGIPVHVEFKGRTGIREGLEPALAAGQQIDVFDEDIDRVNSAFGKYLMDLEELAKENDYEATANASLMQACRDAGGGTLKTIPYQPNVFAFFYNKDLFDQAGITAVPATWDEFLTVCQQLKDAGITPMTMDDAYATSLIGYHLGRLVGEEQVRAIVTDGKWDDPAVARLAKDFEELAAKGYFSEMVGSNVWPAGQNSELALGEAAMYLNGSWLPNEVKDIAGESFNWGCFAYPALDGGATGTEANNFGAQVFAINKDSQMSKEAFGLIMAITKGEFDKKLSNESIGIPADSTNSEWPALVACAKPVMEASTDRYTWAVGVEVNEDMTPIIKENFIKLIAGSMTADEFVSAMQAAAK